ncbi:phospholipase A2 inhibitor and Ly6/PLAUR domain-containing protein-like [Engystomops pustulosus]|uniref:phospholipase A2 inhibitor and Ly6/PLAUR domain-containing protein-like n=1 Tax=Engystomops pustulosus TaxID=76066 RepID=UPI003AFAB956
MIIKGTLTHRSRQFDCDISLKCIKCESPSLTCTGPHKHCRPGELCGTITSYNESDEIPGFSVRRQCMQPAKCHLTTVKQEENPLVVVSSSCCSDDLCTPVDTKFQQMVDYPFPNGLVCPSCIYYYMNSWCDTVQCRGAETMCLAFELTREDFLYHDLRGCATRDDCHKMPYYYGWPICTEAKESVDFWAIAFHN